jgi:hypothetical protein
MRSRQCVGCEYYLKDIGGCSHEGSIHGMPWYEPIKSILSCDLANNGKGGVDNRCVT